MLDTVNDVEDDCIIDHLYNGNFCVIRIFKIASEGKRVAYATKFTNISNNSELVRQYNRNKDIGQLYKMFSHVDLFDLEENSLTNIYTTIQGNYNKGKLSLEIEKFCNVYVYPVDRERYMEFYNTQTMISRIQNARENIIRCYYRIKVEGQGYQWVMAVLSGTDNRKKHRILSCFRLINAEELAKIPLDNMISDVVATSGETFSDASLWQNFVSNTDVGMFWKDRDRRFVGVNKAFLDYYGFKSQDNVLGKNDEDMGWHIDPDKFKNDEEDILNKGIQTHGVLGTCINDGTVRNIVASKMPYYKNGRIEGIIGYFLEEGDRTLGKDVDEYSDDITDALNMKGLLDTVQQFVDSYIMNRNDFNIIYIDIVDFRHFINANGQKLAERVLQEVGKKIKEIIGLTGVLARIGGDHFVVLRSAVNLEEDEKLIDEIREEIYNIRRVDHVPCTVYLNIESERFSEARNLENLVIHLMNKSVRADK